jgi:DNA-binding CsgD family transcriptional regulator
MRAKGLSDPEIARSLSTDDHPFTTTMLREANTTARNATKAANISRAQRLKDKGLSNVAIGEKMGINESSVRSLLKPGEMEKLNVLHRIVDFLRETVDRLGVVDIGRGTEHESVIGVARNKMDTAISILKNEGYSVFPVQVGQATSAGKTTIKVLAKPGITYRDVASDLSQIKSIGGWSEDGGRSFSVIKPPLALDPKRLAVNYKETGGDKADGVIYVREGVSDLSLGKARYAQVRIQVGDGHFIKGMAMYSDDIPKGADIVFNTNKSVKDAPGKLDALKPLKIDKATGKVDELNPFGSVVRQIGDLHEDGSLKKVTSVMNLVNEQGDWEKWQDSLSSQMLSKQRPTLVKQQLDLAYEQRKNNLDEILSLTNPAVRRHQLERFADEADSAAVELKAHALPRQGNFVILPIQSLKESEIYAPRFKNGDTVVLVRHPHGGKFEIPELTVNNNHAGAKKLLGNDPPDAVGINPEVAKRLSGADFDGDTVLVIPNNNKAVATQSPLSGLKDFDPQSAYPEYPGMKPMSSQTKQREMGIVSNLITDMTIRGANDAELARAVRHSMVVIDAEKHNLNYRQSAIDNGIQQLKSKYQKPYTETGKAGASTLISRAKSDIRVPDRPDRGIDPATGKKILGPPKSFVDRDGNLVIKTKSSVKLKEAEDAHSLSSGTRVESIYADHANQLKSLANAARKEYVSTPKVERSPSARDHYKDEVASLTAKLKLAESNAPRERAAQVAADTAFKARLAANPHMDAAEIKKTKGLLIQEMRARMDAKKTPIYIEDGEWKAIQAGAISNHMLDSILRNADSERVTKLATPRTRLTMTSVKQQRAASLLSSGMTQAEVAEILGVSLTTLKNSLNGG